MDYIHGAHRFRKVLTLFFALYTVNYVGAKRSTCASINWVEQQRYSMGPRPQVTRAMDEIFCCNNSKPSCVRAWVGVAKMNNVIGAKANEFAYFEAKVT